MPKGRNAKVLRALRKKYHLGEFKKGAKKKRKVKVTTKRKVLSLSKRLAKAQKRAKKRSGASILSRKASCSSCAFYGPK